MESIMMSKEAMLSKIPFYLVETVDKTFSRCEKANKTSLIRFSVEETHKHIGIVGYDKRGRSYSVAFPQQPKTQMEVMEEYERGRHTKQGPRQLD